MNKVEGMPASAAPLQRIVLTGFMGSGKTTTGRLLAERLRWAFLDLDDEIACRTGFPVPEIFARFGESFFRREESLALAECLTGRQVVLALGGGAPEAEGNRALLRGTPHTAVLYLEGAFETLYARCLAQASAPHAVIRPVLADASSARHRFTQRTPLYAEIATATFDTEGHSPEVLAGRIHKALRFNIPAVKTP